MASIESTAVRMTRSRAKLATPAPPTMEKLTDIYNSTDIDQNDAKRVSFGIALDLNDADEKVAKASRSSLPRIATPFNKTPLPVEEEEEEEEEEGEEVLSLLNPPKGDVDTQTDKSLGQLKREIKAAVESKGPSKRDQEESEDALDLADMMSKKMLLNGVPKATGVHTRFDSP